jgi:hypothetical protein
MLQGHRGHLMEIWRETWSYVQPTLTLFGGVAVLCTSLAAAAYGLFRLTGEKWLQAKFDERLAAYKHEQQKELEGLKFRIARLMDRATKFHQREFEVLPEAWARLNETYARTVAFVSALQIYPSLDDKSPECVEEFISRCKLQDWQKDELRRSAKKDEYYRKNIFWYRLNDLQGNLQECHIYVLKNSILMPKNIRDKIYAN